MACIVAEHGMAMRREMGRDQLASPGLLKYRTHLLSPDPVDPYEQMSMIANDRARIAGQVFAGGNFAKAINERSSLSIFPPEDGPCKALLGLLAEGGELMRWRLHRFSPVMDRAQFREPLGVDFL